ncbi:MAG: hypothetical protein J6B55_08320 [Clostridia bacterium]|nr:hypothetical protein [Clostridia bacterium]
MANENIHEGHRERMRKRFIEDGEHFETHELLELLLTYSIPRRDTNRTAHILLKRFGSYDGILSADMDELTSVEGVGQRTAMLMNVIGELSRRTEKSKKKDRTVYDSEEKIGRLLIKKYQGKRREECHIMLFDGKHCMVGFKKLGEGTVNATHVVIRTAVEYAYKHRAVSTVISHNHPGGIACPTDSDMRFTDGLRTAFRLMGINFDGHFIVAENDWYMIDGRREEY